MRSNSKRMPGMRSWEWLLLALGLAAFLLLAYFASPQKSAAFDEQFHLAAGYAYLKTGDFRLANTHPPLIGLTAALPLLGRDDITLPLDHPSWAQRNRFVFSDQFLWKTSENPQELLELARLPIMLFGVLLIAAIFGWTRQVFGRWPGWIAFAFALLDPNLIANARLVTTDLGLACLLFLTMWSLWRWLGQPSWRTGVLIGILVGLTATAKYTGLILGPIALFCALLYPAKDRQVLGRRVLALMGMEAIGLMTLWIVYLFDWGRTDWLPFPLPAPYYWQSLGDTLIKLPVEAEDKLSFLLGQASVDGWWYYFPVALGVKTPLPTLILLAIGCVLLARSGRVRQLACVWLPPIAFLLFGMTGILTIGYRHILPAVPFMIMLAGWGGGMLLEQSSRSRPWPAVALGGLLIWMAVGAGRIYPHQEAYFNEIAGDWRGWSTILVDSNLDWGQDLIALRQLLFDYGIEEVNLSYFGMAPPEAYGIRFRPLPGYLRFVEGPEVKAYDPYSPDPGWYAIGATSLRLGTLTPDTVDHFEYFAQQEPIDKAGYSIYLYMVENELPSENVVISEVPVAQILPGRDQARNARWAKTNETRIFPLGEGFIGDYQVVDVDFERQMRLLGYEILNGTPVSPGSTLDLMLYWQVGDRPISSPAPTIGPPLASFIHLTGDEPWQIVAQYDGWETAVRGLESGDIIAHKASIWIDEDVAPADYILLIGLYSPQTMDRLHPTTEDGEDFVRLQSLTVSQ